MKFSLGKLVLITTGFLLLNFSSAYSEELIIIFSNEITDKEVNSILSKYNISFVSELSPSENDFKYILGKTEEKQIRQLMEALKSEEGVREVFLNFELQLQSGLSFSGLLQEIVRNNQLTELERAVSYLQRFKGISVTLAYLDSGFLSRRHHVVEELLSSGRLIKIRDERNNIEGYGIDVVSDPSRYTFFPEDVQGHGTELVSLGLVYSPNGHLLIVKLSEDGSSLKFSNLLRALSAVKIMSQKYSGRIVVNMSLNTPIENIISAYQKQGYSREEAEQKYVKLIDWFRSEYVTPLLQAGVVLITAGSNEGIDIEVFPGLLPEIICVGRADFEGKEKFSDVLAPSAVYAADGDFRYLRRVEGTSYATALVSAFVGEVLRVNPNLDTQELKVILRYNDFVSGLYNMIEVLQGGEMPQRAEFTPRVDFAVVARLATVYSALKDIRNGLDTSNPELIASGVAKLETDLGYRLPFEIEITDDFSNIAESIRIIYSREESEASLGYQDEGFSYAPMYLPPNILFGIFN